MSEALRPGASPAFTPELLQRFDRPGPRYTSYPTADRFDEGFGEAEYVQAALERVAAPARRPLSLYVHIPFCESVCYYCACNKVVTRDHGRAAEYLAALEQEMAMQTTVLGVGEAVSQLHLGGGTPTFLSDAELDRLMASLHRHFAFVPGAELSVEVDPRTVTRERLQHLAALGFNRVSFGVQDFDPQVQQAVHRVQPYEAVSALVEASRKIGFESVNVDLIYGLPRQTVDSFARTVAQVGALRPDRIALYAYAHLPTRFKTQRRIAVNELPGADQRMALLGGALGAFLEQGYVYIGMDHFALPSDSLAVAKREGRLHRNFQGYSTRPDCDLVALGVSAIGQMGSTYSQNAKTLPDYYEALRAGRLPVARGVALTDDDRLRRAAIMALMCQGRLDFADLRRGFGVDARAYFRAELAQLEALAAHGLVELTPWAVQVTARGWYVVRAVAMVFDRHLQADRERFSRIV